MTYKFDEKMYVIGDVYILHRFVTDDEGHSKEEKIWGILSDYKPNKLTFMTVAKGLIVYWADIQLNDHHVWSPKGRVDTLGNKYVIMMGGLKAYSSIVGIWGEDMNFGEMGTMVGYIYACIGTNDTGYAAALCDLSDHSKVITFDEE